MKNKNEIDFKLNCIVVMLFSIGLSLSYLIYKFHIKGWF